jgi:nucleoid-associated protein YgaU
LNLKSALKTIKLNESTISMILGAFVIIVVGVLVINYFGGKQEGETIPPVDIEKTTSETLPTTHTVAEGEDLWSISEAYYGTGYNWVDIVEANDMDDPGKIKTGQELTIPDVAPRVAIAEQKEETETQSVTTKPETLAQNNEDKNANQTHVVEQGENLWTISEKYFNSGYNWVDIAKENELENPNLIAVGQELSIPSVQAKIVTKSTEENEGSISGATYTVETGDNLWKIAVRAYGDGYKWSEIAKENDLYNPSLIHSGNNLTLPR